MPELEYFMFFYLFVAVPALGCLVLLIFIDCLAWVSELYMKLVKKETPVYLFGDPKKC